MGYGYTAFTPTGQAVIDWMNREIDPLPETEGFKFIIALARARALTLGEAAMLEELVVQQVLHSVDLKENAHLEAWRHIVHSISGGTTDWPKGPPQETEASSTEAVVNKGRGGVRVSNATMLAERRTDAIYLNGYHLPKPIYNFQLTKKNVADLVLLTVCEARHRPPPPNPGLIPAHTIRHPTLFSFTTFQPTIHRLQSCQRNLIVRTDSHRHGRPVPDANRAGGYLQRADEKVWPRLLRHLGREGARDI